MQYAVLSGQIRYCFSYGWPSAAGGMALPISPASTTMVVRNGSICSHWGGTGTSRI